MGKRKRRAPNPPIVPLSHPDGRPCSSGINSSSAEKSSDHISTGIDHTCSSAKEAMGSHEQQSSQFSPSHHHHHHHHQHHPGRSVLLKRSRHRGHHYPRHNPGYHHSVYPGKSNAFFDRPMYFKVGNRWNSELGYDTEDRERALCKPERIRSSSKSMEITPWDDENMVCGTCQGVLRQKHHPGSGIDNSEPSVVAVLVCGHVYHADCLDQRTPAQDATDPPCPLCSELLLKSEAS